MARMKTVRSAWRLARTVPAAAASPVIVENAQRAEPPSFISRFSPTGTARYAGCLMFDAAKAQLSTTAGKLAHLRRFL
jgi:hypothetical protein